MSESWTDAWAADTEVSVLLHTVRWSFNYQAIVNRLRNDQQFAIEMRVCKEWGIPHSQFLSWSEEDQSKALGHYAYEAQRCGNCGLHPTDWEDPLEPKFAATTKVCPGCAELDKFNRWAHEQAEINHSKDSMDGVKTFLKAVED